MPEIVMVNPATGEKLGVKQSWTPEQIIQAYKNARSKFATFRKTTIFYRVNEVRKIKKYIVDNMENLIENLSQDLGKTRSEVLLMELFPVLDAISFYEKNTEKILQDKKIRTPLVLIGKKSYVFYEPLGTILVIAPWNFPFTLSLIPIISAVLAGNTVIYKPSERATYAGLLIEKILKESGFEQGIVTVVYGKSNQIGNVLIDGKPDKIFLTGSTSSGKIIMEKAAKYLIPVELELGGKDPMIICNDANITRAANAATWGSLLNSGQACVAIERIYVQHEVYDQFINKIVENVKKVKQGWDTKGDVDIGSIATEEQMSIIEDHIDDAVTNGAQVLIGGKRKKGTLFFEPTVLVDVDHRMKIIRKETFGPVICILKFNEVEDAIRLANDSIYGLNASVWSADINKAVKIAREIVVGGVAINNALTASANFALPFGGAKHSGIGRYHGSYGLHTFSNIKAVLSEKGKKDNEINWYPFRSDKYERFLYTFKCLFSEKISEKIKGLPNMIKLMRSGR